MDKDLNNLIEFCNVVPEAFLILGTCLGAVRDKKFIKDWQFDIDLGIMKGDFKEEYVKELQERGFGVVMNLLGREDGFLIAFKKDGIKFDLITFKEEEDFVWTTAFSNPDLQPRGRHVFSKEAFKVEEHEIDGFKFRSLGEKYLEEYYGDWRVPRSDWLWFRDPKSFKP